MTVIPSHYIYFFIVFSVHKEINQSTIKLLHGKQEHSYNQDSLLQATTPLVFPSF